MQIGSIKEELSRLDGIINTLYFVDNNGYLCVWAIDLSTQGLYLIDKKTGKSELKALLPISNIGNFSVAKSNLNYVHMIKAVDKIFIFPSMDHNILVYDIKNEVIIKVQSESETSFYDTNQIWLIGNRIWAVTESTETIYEIEIDTMKIVRGYHIGKTDLGAAFGPAAYSDKYIICASKKYDQLYIFNIETKQGKDIFIKSSGKGFSCISIYRNTVWLGTNSGDVIYFELLFDSNEIEVKQVALPFCTSRHLFESLTIGNEIWFYLTDDFDVLSKDFLRVDVRKKSLIQSTIFNESDDCFSKFRILYKREPNRIGILIKGYDTTCEIDIDSKQIEYNGFKILPENRIYDVINAEKMRNTSVGIIHEYQNGDIQRFLRIL